MPRAAIRNSALALIALCALLLVPGASRGQGAATGTQFVVFWRGDLRIIATRPDTKIELINVATGAQVATNLYTSNFNQNPFTLNDAGDSFEGNCGGSTLRVRIIATTARGPKEDKPIIVWTGFLEAGLKHPASPPTVTNAWASNLPALAPGSVENGTEIGREFWGFVSREMYISARRGPQPTSIQIQDLVTNVEADGDDSQTLTPASPALVAQDADMEFYYLDTFEDDTVHVTANTDISVLVGVATQTGYDWTITPPSWGAGEDARELGTLFYTFVTRDLTIFPTQDNTRITITDVSDIDDTISLTLTNGDLAGDYDLFTTDTFARNGTGITPRAANPAVRLFTLSALTAPFDNDFVKVEADKPVLLYVGPKAADTFEYADVAYSVQYGPSSYLIYAYAQNGGAEDLQIFAYDPATTVRITSLTYTTGFRNNGAHDFTIPVPTPWLGGNPTYGDYYWASTIWNGEMLRIETTGPITIIDGDYDGANFGCFIPFVSQSGLLKPIADAGPDLSLCPGATSVLLDGTGSFDADQTAGALPPSWSWDLDATVDSDGDTDPTNDPDRTGPTVNWMLPGPGPWTVTLTYTDDDGQTDTDTLTVQVGDNRAPILDCTPFLQADADPVGGGAWVSVRATATDECDPSPAITNTFTAGGADASEIYPCGPTNVTFTATDASGNSSVCSTAVIVRDITGPAIDCPARLNVPADSPTGADVNLVASAVDNCDPSVTVTNDRTSGGFDASDFYPCGETLVTFSGRDVSGNPSSCQTIVTVAPPALPEGVGAALRAWREKTDSRDVVNFRWDLAPPPPLWQHYEVYRTDRVSVRPFPPLSTDPSLTAQRYTDSAAVGPLLFYEVYGADCIGTLVH